MSTTVMSSPLMMSTSKDHVSEFMHKASTMVFSSYFMMRFYVLLMMHRFYVLNVWLLVDYSWLLVNHLWLLINNTWFLDISWLYVSFLISSLHHWLLISSSISSLLHHWLSLISSSLHHWLSLKSSLHWHLSLHGLLVPFVVSSLHIFLSNIFCFKLL